MNYLIVVAHPDDEVLGAGGVIYKLVHQGDCIAVCTMSNHAAARTDISDTLSEDQIKAFNVLGVSKSYAADFPNIKMNTVPHLELVQFIEKAIIDFKPDVIITHFPGDVNNDHVQTSVACQAAFRLFQRRSDIKPVEELWFMEIPSSTEWAINTTLKKFSPNLFVEIGKEGLRVKMDALSQYHGVIRDYPHPRSTEAISSLATCRGAEARLMYAEAFECVFRRIY